MIIKHTNALLVGATFLLTSLCSGAHEASNIAIITEAPHFSFIIENNLSPRHQDKLSPQEAELAQQITPLLKAQAHQDILDLIKAYQPPDQVKRSAALWLMQGQLHLTLNQPADAEHALNQALTLSPNLVRAHRTLATLYVQQKQYNKAQQHLAKAIINGMQDPQLFGQLAYINLNQGAPWSAIAGFQQALLLQPHHQPWKKGLLYALQQSGDHQTALTMVNELLNTSPTDKNLWLQRAQLSIALDSNQQAISSMEMALRHGEKNPTNLLNTAQLHLANGSMDRATDLLVTLSSNQHQNFERIEPAISWLIDQQQSQSALIILSKVKNITSRAPAEQSVYYATLGNAHEYNQPKIALKQYKKSLALDPNNARVLIKLAQHYRQKKQYSHAELYYQRAEIFPKYAKQSLSGLAQLAVDQQHFNKALSYLEKLKSVSDNKLSIEKNIAILNRLRAQKT